MRWNLLDRLLATGLVLGAFVAIASFASALNCSTNCNMKFTYAVDDTNGYTYTAQTCWFCAFSGPYTNGSR